MRSYNEIQADVDGAQSKLDDAEDALRWAWDAVRDAERDCISCKYKLSKFLEERAEAALAITLEARKELG